MIRDKSPTGRIRIYGEFVDVVLKLGMPDACLELERYARQVSSENVADIYCGYSADSFPETEHAKQFTKVGLLHNLIHTNLRDSSFSSKKTLLSEENLLSWKCFSEG
jgi:hypothetical protein